MVKNGLTINLLTGWHKNELSVLECALSLSQAEQKGVKKTLEDDPCKAYRTLKKMSSQPGDWTEDNTLQLLSLLEDILSAEQSIESIAGHFAKIIQEYPPLDRSKLPGDVKVKINKLS